MSCDACHRLRDEMMRRHEPGDESWQTGYIEAMCVNGHIWREPVSPVLVERELDRMYARRDLLARLRDAQSRLACAEPARRLDACSCWHGYEAAIRIVEEGL